MSLFSLLIPLVAQVGPFSAPGGTDTPFPERTARPAQSAAPSAAAPASVDSPKAQDCRAAVDDSAEDGLELAESWAAEANGAETAEAAMCLGLAHSRLENWTAAEQAFLAGRESAGANRLLRARLGAMAGSAALAAPAPERALAHLDAAKADCAGLASPLLEAEIALDRARALVALKRDAEADNALADARTANPQNAEAWLLSATLARRMNRLAEAQSRIERAAELLPVDPAIGLEAGVIAMLAGHEDAARKSWQSVLVAAPESAEAATAKSYIAQLGPAPQGTAPRAPETIGR